MNKTRIAIFAVGVVIVVGIVWYLNSSKSSLNQNTQNIQQSSEPQKISVVYDSTKPFTPQAYEVKEGSQVVLEVTSDIADELHFHGYDLHTDLESGKLGQIEFTADKTGRFEFELEDHKTTLGVIEVYPK